MSTDRELLELAAKAAGIALEWDGPPEMWQPLYYQGKTYHGWNPLTDDGDALRLAVKLRLKVRYHGVLGQALVDRNVGDNPIEVNVEDCGEDEYAATRRAIVRAAAGIGRKM